MEFESRLRKLQKKKKADYAFYKAKIREAVNKGGKDFAAEIRGEAQMERDSIQSEIEELTTRYLTDVGQQLLVPIPDQEEGKPSMWQRTSFTDS